MNTGRPRYSAPCPRQAANAKGMRRSLTPAERKLWYALRHSIVLRHTHFRRQVSLGRYIADFCCLSARLIVEVDGGQHFTDEAEAYATARTHYLNEQGFRVLRFTNRDVLTETENIVATIYASLENTLSGDPSPAAPNPTREERMEMEP